MPGIPTSLHIKALCLNSCHINAAAAAAQQRVFVSNRLRIQSLSTFNNCVPNTQRRTAGSAAESASKLVLSGTAPAAILKTTRLKGAASAEHHLYSEAHMKHAALDTETDNSQQPGTLSCAHLNSKRCITDVCSSRSF